MNEATIAERLVQFGKDKRDVPVFSESSGVPDADALVNNFREFPHAFVLATLRDFSENPGFLNYHPVYTLTRPVDGVHVAAQKASSLLQKDERSSLPRDSENC